MATSEPVSTSTRPPPLSAVSAGPLDAGAGPSDEVSAVGTAITDLFRLAGSRRVHQARQGRTGVALSRTGWELLRRVDDLGPIRVSQLAELLELSLPVTSRAVQRLADQGLVARRADPADGRATRVVVTSRGGAARAKVQAAMRDELDAALAAWPAHDRRRLAALLPRLVADMRSTAP